MIRLDYILFEPTDIIEIWEALHCYDKFKALKGGCSTSYYDYLLQLYIYSSEYNSVTHYPEENYNDCMNVRAVVFR